MTRQHIIASNHFIYDNTDSEMPNLLFFCLNIKETDHQRICSICLNKDKRYVCDMDGTSDSVLNQTIIGGKCVSTYTFINKSSVHGDIYDQLPNYKKEKIDVHLYIEPHFLEFVISQLPYYMNRFHNTNNIDFGRFDSAKHADYRLKLPPYITDFSKGIQDEHIVYYIHKMSTCNMMRELFINYMNVLHTIQRITLKAITSNLLYMMIDVVGEDTHVTNFYNFVMVRNNLGSLLASNKLCVSNVYDDCEIVASLSLPGSNMACFTDYTIYNNPVSPLTHQFSGTIHVHTLTELSDEQIELHEMKGNKYVVKNV